MQGQVLAITKEDFPVENWRSLNSPSSGSRPTVPEAACLLQEAVGTSARELELLNLAITREGEAVYWFALAAVMDEVVSHYGGPQQALPA